MSEPFVPPETTVVRGDAWHAVPALGPRLGRYELRGLLGAGGMGAVFEAFDPELERAVAVKVLRSTSRQLDEVGTARLRREGLTMAKLAHPNVIRVYDVGVEDGHVFVAMELVRGGTLAEWLRRAPRTADAIVAAFLQAGRGLAAAHDAGVIHRDFKPQNVLVGDDDRVLVTDFGLARSVTDDEATAPFARAGAGDPLVTEPGRVIGTPAFMAPEQQSGVRVDARADQYSFCKALWNALLASESDRATASTLVPGLPPSLDAPQAQRVPARLRAPLLRGLAATPAERFPSMRELLAELEPRPPGRWRLWAIGAALGAAIAGGGVWAVAAGEPADPCPAPAAQRSRVWDAARRAGLRDRLVAIDPARGRQRFEAAAAVLDRAAPAWQAVHVEACRATRVHGRQSDTALDARMGCLDRWLGELDAVVGGLERAADPVGLEGAIKAIGSIAPLDRCADVDALLAATQLPAAPAARAEAQAITAELEAVNGDRRAGRFDGLVARADAAIARARALGHDGTLARALATRWRVAVVSGDIAGGVAVMRELTEVAAGVGDDVEAANTWALMGRLTATFQGQPDKAKVMMLAARAAAARAGNPVVLRAEVLTNEADVLTAAGDPAAALANLEAARRLLSDAGADQLGSVLTPRLAGLLQSVGEAHWAAGRHDEAVAALRQARALFDRAFGPDAVDAAGVDVTLAQVLRAQRALEPAEAAARDGLWVRERRDPDAADTAIALAVLAEVVLDRGRRDEALALARRAVAVARASMPAGDASLLGIEITLAKVHAASDRAADALAIYGEVLASAEQDKIVTDSVAWWWLERGDLERRRGRCAEAVAAYRKAAEVGAALQGEASHHVRDARDREAACRPGRRRD